KFAGIGITDNLTLVMLPSEGAADLHGDVRENARDRRGDALFDIGDGFAAVLDGGKKILHMRPNGGGYVLFEVLLVHVLGILIVLDQRLAAERGFLFALRDKSIF